MRYLLALPSALLLTMTAVAQQPRTAARQMTVPIAGAAGDGSGFTGTVTVQRFEERGGQVFAVGVVNGSLSGAAGPIGTAVNVPAAFPVRVGSGQSARVGRPSQSCRPSRRRTTAVG